MSGDLVWRAGPDGIEHASKPRVPRTLCGQLVLPERMAWPKARVCSACLTAVEPVVIQRAS